MEHETTFDLNFTLLKREFFLKFVRKATSLESKIRNLNNFSYSTEKIDQFYGGLKTFLLDLHGNFQKVCPILKLFLTGVGQILEWLKLVRPHIQGDTGSTFEASNLAGLASLNEVFGLIDSAVSYIEDVNTKCDSVVVTMANLIVTVPDEKFTELTERTRAIVDKLDEDVNILSNLSVEGEAEKAKTKILIEKHNWKKHEMVKVRIDEAKKQIRKVKESSERSTAIQDEAIRRRDFLMSSLEEMTSSASKEKEEKCSELEDALKEFKKFDRRLQHQIADAKESNKNLVDAATIAQNSDPSGQWRLMRIPERTQATLCCLLKGPIDSMRYLKINPKRRRQFPEGLLRTDESPISELITLENLDSSTEVKWPLIACIPQLKLINANDEKKVRLKLSGGNRTWTTEIPLAVNRQYSPKQVAIDKGLRFTEVKLTNFCTIAVFLSPQADPYYSLPPTPGHTSPCVRPLPLPEDKKTPERAPGRIPPEPPYKFLEDAVLTDMFLYELAEKFNESASKILLRLGCSISDIKNAREDNPHSVVDAFSSCLKKWKHAAAPSTSFSTGNKVKTLKEVLQKVDRNDLVAMVEAREAEVQNK